MLNSLNIRTFKYLHNKLWTKDKKNNYRRSHKISKKCRNIIQQENYIPTIFVNCIINNYQN